MNIGATGQSKAGNLTIHNATNNALLTPDILSTLGGATLNTGGATYGLIVQNGNVGIGTASPGAKLEIDTGFEETPFKIIQQMGSTVILRPNAVGDETGITPLPAPPNWQNVDEAIPDGNSTIVYNGNTSYQRDLYNLSDTAQSGVINWIKVWIVTWTPTISYAKTAIKTGGVVYEGTEIAIASAWTNYSTQYNTNPQTGAAWTWAQLDNLQAGVSLKNGTSVIYCTQVYVEVSYIASSPINTFVINSVGNVGIGTTSPAAKLDILTGDNTYVTFASAPVHTGTTQELSIGYNSASDYGVIQSVHNNVAYTALALNPLGGNVGIGIVPPTANFQVAQGTAGVGTVSNAAGGTTVTGVGTQFLNTFKVGDTITVDGQTVAISAIASNTSMTTAAIPGGRSNVGYTLVGGTRFSVLGNGNVGIGTTSPGQKLDISGSVNVSGKIYAPGTWVYIDKVNLAATAGAITISDIPSTYEFLKLTFKIGTDFDQYDVWIRFNDDAGNNYDYVYVKGNGTNATSGGTNAVTYGRLAWFAINDWTVGEATISNDASSYKTVTSYYGGWHVGYVFDAGISNSVWRNNAKINKITIFSTAGRNMKAGSTLVVQGMYW